MEATFNLVQTGIFRARIFNTILKLDWSVIKEL